QLASVTPLLEKQKGVVLEGWLRKRSRHRGVFRARWVVLTRSQILTYTDENRTSSPTEVIELQQLVAV
ncbi:hypothetical protein T492DRAFT_566832, partial [Pavlovales sp. CCMP2436]